MADYTKLNSTMAIIFTNAYKPLPYLQNSLILDSDYAGEAWNTLKDTTILGDLIENRRN